MSDDKWSVLTKTTRGTPMGELLRRYWWPVAGESEIKSGVILPIKLLGEDLVLFQDYSGTLGLVERKCAHRRADLKYGYVEREGIRCSYHGWHFAPSGACLQIPFESSRAPRPSLIAYSVQSRGGMIWAYLGPNPAPLIPNYEFFNWRNGFVQIVISEVPCNWFQAQENSVDPVHFDWQHANWAVRENPPERAYQPTLVELGFEEFAYGFIFRRVRADCTREHPMWKVGRVCLWPAAVFSGNHLEFRVPMDDENTLAVTWSFSRVPNEQEPFVQERIPTWRAPVFDDKGEIIHSHITNQDFLAWLGQGEIADRTRENLRSSDQGILMLRRAFLRELESMASGREPKSVIRDPSANAEIRLPVIERNYLMRGASLHAMLADPDKCGRLKGYDFQAGQPPDVRAAFERAMGITGLEISEPDDRCSTGLI